MRKLIITAALMLVSCATQAEKIGHVEYTPPKELKSWQENTIDENGIKGKSYVHSEKGMEESFIVTHLAHPELDDATKKQLSSLMEFNQERVNQLQTELKRRLENAFPDTEISIHTIDMEPHSLFYAWTIKNENGKLISHSWERIFSTAEGKTSLFYGYHLKGKEAKTPDTDPWVETLRDAKLKKSSTEE